VIQTGTLYAIGVGPGDPELVTVKAARLLARIGVIAYPAPPEGPSLAHAIAAPHLGAVEEEIVLRLPCDPNARPDEVYDAGARTIAARLAAGRDVAVLCEGDPLLFGSFISLFARLAGRYPIEVVPGVSSLTACAAVAGHPLAARDDALVIIPAPRPAEDIERLLLAAEAAAIMKLGRHFAKVTGVLDRLGLSERAVYVERAGQAGQRILPLAQAAGQAAPYFSMILVHKRGKAWN
jgi:precorrin-2/cobalt-factor-2 C20-methyltransferase